jgi:hypothetical protein
MISGAQAKVEAGIGAVLMATPWWVGFLHDVVSPVASSVAAICGAIVGIHAVWRLIKRRGRA